MNIMSKKILFIAAAAGIGIYFLTKKDETAPVANDPGVPYTPQIGTGNTSTATNPIVPSGNGNGSSGNNLASQAINAAGNILNNLLPNVLGGNTPAKPTKFQPGQLVTALNQKFTVVKMQGYTTKGTEVYILRNTVSGTELMLPATTITAA